MSDVMMDATPGMVQIQTKEVTAAGKAAEWEGVWLNISISTFFI
jgi:hypothetical protein